MPACTEKPPLSPHPCISACVSLLSILRCSNILNTRCRLHPLRASFIYLRPAKHQPRPPLRHHRIQHAQVPMHMPIQRRPEVVHKSHPALTLNQPVSGSQRQHLLNLGNGSIKPKRRNWPTSMRWNWQSTTLAAPCQRHHLSLADVLKMPRQFSGGSEDGDVPCTCVLDFHQPNGLEGLQGLAHRAGAHARLFADCAMLGRCWPGCQSPRRMRCSKYSKTEREMRLSVGPEAGTANHPKVSLKGQFPNGPVAAKV